MDKLQICVHSQTFPLLALGSDHQMWAAKQNKTPTCFQKSKSQVQFTAATVGNPEKVHMTWRWSEVPSSSADKKNKSWHLVSFSVWSYSKSISFKIHSACENGFLPLHVTSLIKPMHKHKAGSLINSHGYFCGQFPAFSTEWCSEVLSTFDWANRENGYSSSPDVHNSISQFFPMVKDFVEMNSKSDC